MLRIMKRPGREVVPAGLDEPAFEIRAAALVEEPREHAELRFAVGFDARAVELRDGALDGASLCIEHRDPR